MTLISVSLIAADLSSPEAIRDAARRSEEAGVDMLHIDVEDGVAAAEVTVWNDARALSHIASDLPLDVHIMVEKPHERFMEYVKAGARMLSFHIEDTPDVEHLASKLHDEGVKVGFALRPETSVDRVAPYLSLADFVLVLSVHPGPAGQPFIPESLEKVAEIKRLRPDVLVTIDGGMNEERARLAREVGADIIVAGAAIFGADDMSAAVRSLR